METENIPARLKKCKKCCGILPISEFKPIRKTKWFRKICNRCHLEWLAAYRKKCGDAYLKKNWQYYTDNPKRRLYKNLCTSAKNKQVPKTVSLADISIPDRCPYLGVPLDLYRVRNQRNRYGPSVDRIDSSKGYTPDNIEVVSLQANKMKNDSTLDELICFAYGVLKRHRSDLISETGTLPCIKP